MKKIIIYGSHYGTTKAYAEKLSELSGISAISYKQITDLAPYDEVIHLGGLYAGGVKGLKETIQSLSPHTKLIVVTVGLADISKKENTDHIKKSVFKQVPQPVLAQTTILHLRGGIDYSRLNFMHKTMMSLVYKKAKSTPEAEKTAEIRDLIETYQQKVDFTDFRSLQQVIDVI